MEWMISHQQARRNLTLGELIYAHSMVSDEIALENKAKKLSTLRQNIDSSRCVQMDTSETKERDRSTNTREQVAKMSGVGTVAIMWYFMNIENCILILDVIIYDY